MILLKKYSWVIAGVILGALGGLLYWNFVGCASGTCGITSIWYKSTVYGSVIGGLLANTFTKEKTN
jgi:hypothetical protein